MNYFRRAFGGRPSNHRSTIVPYVKSPDARKPIKYDNLKYVNVKDESIKDDSIEVESSEIDTSESSEYSSDNAEHIPKIDTPAAKRISITDLGWILRETTGIEIQKMKKIKAKAQLAEDKRCKLNEPIKEQVIQYVHDVLMRCLKNRIVTDKTISTSFHISFDLFQTGVIEPSVFTWVPKGCEPPPLKVNGYVSSGSDNRMWLTDVRKWINQYLEISGVDLRAVTDTRLRIQYFKRNGW